MGIDFAELWGVDAPTKKRRQNTGQLEILLDGFRIGLIRNTNGATAFIHEDVADHMKPMIRDSVLSQLKHMGVKDVKFLPPKPTFTRARPSDL